MCVECFQLAGEPKRYELLTLLAQYDRLRVCDLMKHLKITQPTVTYHLQLLSDAKIVLMKKEGCEHWFVLNRMNDCFRECGFLEVFSKEIQKEPTIDREEKNRV